MKYWILKTEPESYSFADLMDDKKTCWNGVRNFQARNNIRSMKVGDQVVIYESVGPRAAVGTAKIISKPYQDPLTKEDWSAIDLAGEKPFLKPVTLSQMKADKILKHTALVKNSRLSVCPLSAEEFKRLLSLAEG